MLLIICRVIDYIILTIRVKLEKQKLLLKLGKAIRKRRIELGFSQEAFADIDDLHRTYIGSIERGEKILHFSIYAKSLKG